MEHADIYPIDYSALNLGDYITPEKLERVTGHKVNTNEYDFALLNLCNEIADRMVPKNNGYSVTCCREGAGIRILTNEDAARKNWRYREQSLNRLARSTNKLLTLDRSALTSEDREIHDRRALIAGRMQQLITENERKERKKALSWKQDEQITDATQ